MNTYVKRGAALALILAMALGQSMTALADSGVVSSGTITAGESRQAVVDPNGPGGTGNTVQADQASDQTAGDTGTEETTQVVQTVTLQENEPVVIRASYTSEGAIMDIAMTLNGVSGAISYGTYVNHGGYLAWRGNGSLSGGTEVSTHIESIQIAITGDVAETYDIYYSGTSAIAGQHGWAAAEQLMGTQDRGDYLTSISVVLVPKGSGAPGSTANRFLSAHTGNLTFTGTGTFYNTGVTGWVDHDQVRYYFQNGIAVTGWQYIDGYKYYFNEDGSLDQDVNDRIGKQKSYRIRVNKELNVMTIYAPDGENGYIIPVKSMLTSVGDDTPVGTFQTPEKYRWRFMVNDTYTQYATRIIANQGFLIHSITYEKQDANTLIAYGYNNLGVTRSLGCIRLNCGNAAWVYNNCALGTEIEVYEDKTSPGPFFKPYQVWIPEDQTYDPTDPAFS